MNPFEVYNIPPKERRFEPVYTTNELYIYIERLRQEGLLKERGSHLAEARAILTNAAALKMEEAAITPAGDFTPPFIYIPPPRFSPLIDENGRHYPLTGNTTDDVNEWSDRLWQKYKIDAFVTDTTPEDGKPSKESAFLDFKSSGMKQLASSWKMHISATTPQALEALVEMAYHYRLPHVKISSTRHLALFTNPEGRQRGKSATFYHFEKNTFNQLIDWQAVAYAAEAIVAAYGGPGPEVRWDRKLSDTIFYRNDLDMEGKQLGTKNLEKYLSDHNIPQEHAYNPGNQPNPWENLRMHRDLKLLRKLTTDVEKTLQKFQRD